LFILPLTHQAPVVWKLAQVQASGPWYICGWRKIYSYFTSNANRWAPGHMFSSIKYEHFVQVSSNQKHVFIMSADVRCGQESQERRHSQKKRTPQAKNFFSSAI